MSHSDSHATFADALRQFEAGRLAEAEQACREILASRPADADALNLLARILCDRSEFDAAMPLLVSLLTGERRDSRALRTLGHALHATGQFPIAIDILAQASAIYPDDAETWTKLGQCLFETHRFAEAADISQRAFALQPGNQAACAVFGLALKETGRLDEAAAVYRHALALHPGAAHLHAGLGAVLINQGKLDEGVAAFGEAAVLAPDHASEWLAQANHGIGLVLRQKEQHEAAVAALQQAIALRPQWPDAHNNLGLTFKDLGRLDDAIACYRHAIELDPRHAIAHMNLGVALLRQDRFEEAHAALQLALALEPNRADVHSNLANVLQGLGRIDEARKHHDQAVALDPENPRARNNRSFSILLCGDLPLGFAEYEWRRKGGSPSFTPRHFSQPEWRGEPLTGRTILLYAEQGFGDSMQFARFVPVLQAMGARVVLQAQRPLAALFALSFPAAHVVAQNEPLPPFDVHLPLMSLPWRLGTTLDTIPADTPYLVADRAKLASWRHRLARWDGLKVGLVWAGNPATKHDRQRSIEARALLEQLPRAGVTLFSLQKDVRPGDRAALAGIGDDLVDLTASFEDFSDTAAAVSALDLVITIDSAVAHLAGALARPTWLLLPYALDWRWLRDRADSPWYPTLRLFRQPQPGDWANVLARVGDALRQRAAGDRRATVSAA